MRNIIRAQNYQTRNDLIVIVSLILFGVVSVVSPQMNVIDVPFSEFTGSFYAVSSDKTFLLYIILVVTTRVCGWDQSDKTINYELLAGHNRSAVYFGRIITSLIWAGAACAVLMFVPPVICLVINGWGYSADFSWVMIRYILAFLPIIRVTFEFALLTFLLRSSGYSLLLGCMIIDGVVLADSILNMESNIEITWHLGITNLVCVTGFPDSGYGYVNGEDVVVYESALGQSLIIGTIVASVLVGAACLAVGCVLFKKRDMK